MSCNSCNRNTSQNNCASGAANSQMYRSSQLTRNSQMYRSGNMNRGMTGYQTNRMVKNGCTKDKADNSCKEEKSDDYRHMAGNCFTDSCNQATAPVDSMMLAMAYVPWQQWRDVMDYEKSIQCGTIFEELVKPWIGRACD